MLNDKNEIVMTNNYSEDTEGARVVIDKSYGFLENAISEIQWDKRFRFCDYGTADGGTSINMWQYVCSKVTSAKKKTEIEVVLNDLPIMDSTTLIKNANYLCSLNKNALVFIRPESFYNQILFKDSLCLGFSATAMHWLSKLPYHIKNHTHANACLDEKDYKSFSEQSARDWELLLSKRREELKIGGQMIFVNLSKNSKGMYLGNNLKDKNLHEILHSIWKAFMVNGEITSEEYESATFQNYYRSEEEYIKGVNDVSGLEVCEMKTELIECPYRKRFNDDGNVDKFAIGLMKTVRSWSEHVFLNALSAERVNKQCIVNRFYNRFIEAIKSAPYYYSMDYIENYLRIVKTK